MYPFWCFGPLPARSFRLGEQFQSPSGARELAHAKIDLGSTVLPCFKLSALSIVALYLYLVLIMTVEENLITLVQQYPVLFDSGHKDYYNITFKVHIWEEIGADLQEPGKLKVIGIKTIRPKP